MNTAKIANYATALALLVLCVLGALVIWRTSCQVLNPGGVRILVDGKAVAPDQVDRIPDDPRAYYGIGNGTDGYAYVQSGVYKRSIEDNLLRLYRKLSGEGWDLVAEYADNLNYTASFSRRPGTSELFARRCFARSVNQKTEFGPARLYRVRESGEFLDVSESYWGGLSQATLDELGITDCGSSWAIHHDGSLLLITENTLWKVSAGSAEVMFHDVSGALKRTELPSGCGGPLPDVRAAATGEVLLYSPGILCTRPDSPPPDLPIAVLVSGAEVRPFFHNEWDDYEIVDAAMGPDGAAYFVLRDSLVRGDCRSVYHGIKATVEGHSEFLRGINCEFGTVDAFSIDADGRMYLVYGGHASLFDSHPRWLIEFPADKVFAGFK